MIRLAVASLVVAVSQCAPTADSCVGENCVPPTTVDYENTAPPTTIGENSTCDTNGLP